MNNSRLQIHLRAPEFIFLFNKNVTLECTYQFETDTLLKTQARNLQPDCSLEPCLYMVTESNYQDSQYQMVIASLKNSTDVQCKNADGYETQLFSIVNCTDNNVKYIQNMKEYFNSQSCKRNKCKCKEGFSNNGWNCEGNVQTKSITYTSKKPIATSTSYSIDLAYNQESFIDKLESSMKLEMSNNNLLVGSIPMVFADFIIIEHIETIESRRKRRQAVSLDNDSGNGTNESQNDGLASDISSSDDEIADAALAESQPLDPEMVNDTTSPDADNQSVELKKDIDVYFSLAYTYNCKTDDCNSTRGIVDDPSESATRIQKDLQSAGIETGIILKDELDLNATLEVPELVLLSDDKLAELAALNNLLLQEKLKEETNPAIKDALKEEAAAKQAIVAMKKLGNSEISTIENVQKLNDTQLEAEQESTQSVAQISFFGSSNSPDDDDNKDDSKKKDGKDAETADEENSLLVNFASLTQGELQKIFGTYKPVNSLNPYMAKADPCRTVEIETVIETENGKKEFINMTYIKHDRIFMLRDFEPSTDCVPSFIDKGLEKDCLQMSVIKQSSMIREMQIEVSREEKSAYINLLLNRKKWNDYLKGTIYTDEMIYPNFKSWAKNPESQLQIKITLKRYTNLLERTEVETREGIVNIIIPRSETCNLIVGSSTSASIKNIYRELRVQPDENIWGSKSLTTGKNCDRLGFDRSFLTVALTFI